VTHKILAALFWAVSLAGCSSAKPPAPVASDTMRITFENKSEPLPNNVGLTVGGSRTLSIDLKGKRMREEEVQITKSGMAQTTQRAVRFSDGKRMCYISSDEKKEATCHDFLAPFSPWEEPMAPGETHFKGEETIAGEKCRIYELEFNGIYTKIWLWNKIALKKLIRMGEMAVVWEATKIERGVPLSDSLFILPEGYDVLTMQEMIEKQRQGLSRKPK
jgi:hypothetical protein